MKTTAKRKILDSIDRVLSRAYPPSRYEPDLDEEEAWSEVLVLLEKLPKAGTLSTADKKSLKALQAWARWMDQGHIVEHIDGLVP